jgi:hypothetical protein
MNLRFGLRSVHLTDRSPGEFCKLDCAGPVGFRPIMGSNLFPMRKFWPGLVNLGRGRLGLDLRAGILRGDMDKPRMLALHPEQRIIRMLIKW